ncbi:MAG: hypothetical protein RIS79_905, partial [Verrucomicrobiota bacterium]
MKNEIDNPSSLRNPCEASIGLVAWLDVLGFKALLDADPDKGMEIWPTVWNFLNELKAIHDSHSPTEYQRRELPSFADRFKFIAFSDSIVASLDLSGVSEAKNELWNPEWHLAALFERRISYLTRRLFDFGLPARGAIDYGSFYHSEIGFAGTPFVNAERQSSSLSFAATSITKAASAVLDQAYDRLPTKSRPWFDHTTEAKTQNGCQTIRILNAYEAGIIKATGDASEFKRRLTEDNIERVVEAVFSDHGKSITDSRVQQKISNTIQM